MKTKKILLFFLASLFGCGYLSAQQQGLFYYYKGKPIPLSVNTQHFLVYADSNKISKELFEKEYRVTEWIEDGHNGILEAQVNIPNDNYNSIVYVLKSKEYIIDIEPVIGDSILTNTSRLFYVRLHNAQDYSLLSSTAQSLGAEIRGEVDFCDNWYELRVNKNSAGNSIEVANKFWETGYFEIIDPGFILHLEPTSGTVCVTDSQFDEQWGMQSIKACSAWKITTGDTTVKIAVIDMGIDTNHLEFDSTYIAFSYDMDTHSSPGRLYFETEGEEERDIPHGSVDIYHGILVSGVIFANHNRHKVAGICPNAGLINISCSFSGKDSCVVKMAQAIQISVLRGAKVINNSWNCKQKPNNPTVSSILEGAIDYALNNDCVIVFASGRNGEDSVQYPARYRPEILTVGAVNYQNARLSCSNYGLWLDVVAPGVDIVTTHNNNSIDTTYGTSFSAPHVSGVAGLMFSVNPNLSGQEVRDYIEQTVLKTNIFEVDSINVNGTWNWDMGYGLLDAHRAVLKAAYHKVYGDTALTFCDTSRHPYTVRAPHNANIDSVSFFWTCSDNLQMVAGQNTDSVWVKFTNSGIGQLQCHIIHDGDTVTSTLDISNMSGRTMYNNLTLNSSLSYPDTFVLSREVVVDSLSMLTWQDKTVLCTPDCRLIVRPRGLLTLNHTTLTSACPNEMWQGIEVVGDRTKRQLPQYQGSVELRNGATIENAWCGIRTGLRGDTVHFATTGGIVKADSAHFVNNCKAVAFYPYTNILPNGNAASNVSRFHNCEFRVDNGNHFVSNDIDLNDHVTLWDVWDIKFKGCSFSNQTGAHYQRRHAIYAEDAGITLDTYCSSEQAVPAGCDCPAANSTYNTFSGFYTAVEANTTGEQHAVQINHALFDNNYTAIKVNGNHFATVTRCEVDLQQVPVLSLSNMGLVLNKCTGYKVEGNTFRRTTYSDPRTLASTGICVDSSGAGNNTLHLNTFENLGYGIYVARNNGKNWTGMQATCNDFYHNKYDIYMSNGASMRYAQGEIGNGADNSFRNTVTSSFYNAGLQQITYYYSSGGSHAPYQNSSNITLNSSASANPCTPTLCNGNGGYVPRLADFQSDLDADTYYTAVRTLMSDTVLDLNELEQWHTAAQTIGDPYSLTETRFMEGYAETFAENAEDAEMANYAEFHAMKLALRGQNDNADNQDNNNSQNSLNSPFINWYTLTPEQITQLQTIAERNTGRASVMAKGVLCFFYGICYEDEWDDAGAHAGTPQQGDDTTGTRAKRTAMDTDNDATLSVYPNPTDDLLFIELSGGAGIANVALYDLQGRFVTGVFNTPQQGGTATINVKSIPAGVYVLRVSDANGKAYHQKIVRK